MGFLVEGNTCLLTKGRRAGNTVTIMKVFGERYVAIKDEKGLERKCSVKHLAPMAQIRAAPDV